MTVLAPVFAWAGLAVAAGVAAVVPAELPTIEWADRHPRSEKKNTIQISVTVKDEGWKLTPDTISATYSPVKGGRELTIDLKKDEKTGAYTGTATEVAEGEYNVRVGAAFEKDGKTKSIGSAIKQVKVSSKPDTQ